MSGPWEDFQQPAQTPASPPAQDGPWSEFAQAAPPTLKDKAIAAVKQAAPVAAQAAGYAADPGQAVKDLATWIAQNPQEAYNKFGKWLPAAGAVAGTAVAPGVGTAAGAGLGEIARQGAGILAGDPNVTRNITPGQISPWAGGQAALQTGLAGFNEVNGLVKAAPGATPYVQGAINAAGEAVAPYAQKVGTGLAKVGQMLTGKPAAKFKMLWNDPGAALPEWLGGAKSVPAAGQGMEDALAQTGIQKTQFNPFEGDDQASQMASDTYNKWQTMNKGGAPAAPVANPPAPLPLADIEAAKQSETPVAVFVGNDSFGPNGSPRALFDVYQKGQQLGQRPTLPFDQLPTGTKVIGSAGRFVDQVPAMPGGVNDPAVLDKYAQTMYGVKAPPETPTISAQEAYNAKRATDYVFPKVISERNAEKIAQMTQFKHAMDDILSNQAGPLQQASKDYARARLGADFSQILPRTKTGDVSTVKALVAAMMEGKRTLALPVTSPLVAGAATSAASLATRGAQFAVQNPTARQALISHLIASDSTQQ